jgi:FdhE protein
MTTAILQPGEIEATASAIPELRLAHARIFSDRARRLRQVAADHSLSQYLLFMAQLAEVQQTELEHFPAVPVPDEALLQRCREHRMPPLAPAGWQRDPAWRDVLQRLIRAVQDRAPMAAQDVLDKLQNRDAVWIERQAELILSGRQDGLERATAPFLAAALQVYWTHLTLGLTPAQIPHPVLPNLCPVCGSPPVASVIRIGGAESGLRYLHCSLCASEWHVVRAKCSHCDNSRGIVYYQVEGASPAGHAEYCPECGSYLKLFAMDKDPQVEPVADDLASLSLDLLMGEQGYFRNGVNLFMVHGEDT